MYPSRRNTCNPWLPSVFNGMFDDAFFAPMMPKTFARPMVNICENDKRFDIEVAVPGMSKSDLKVQIENDNELVIMLEHKDETEDKPHFLRKEFSYCNYRQRFSLPDGIDIEDVSAEMSNGILHIALPKKAECCQAPASRTVEIH